MYESLKRKDLVKAICPECEDVCYGNIRTININKEYLMGLSDTNSGHCECFEYEYGEEDYNLPTTMLG
jgi:hypothetical protein